MSRPNYIDFVEHLYRFNPNFTDIQIMGMLSYAYNQWTGGVSISVWKAKLRKKGLKIPDLRKKKGESNEHKC